MIQLIFYIIASIAALILCVTLLITCRYNFFCAQCIRGCFYSYFVFEEISQNTKHLDNIIKSTESEVEEMVMYKPGFPKSIHKV